jgi:hypothetical protein
VEDEGDEIKIRTKYKGTTTVVGGSYVPIDDEVAPKAEPVSLDTAFVTDYSVHQNGLAYVGYDTAPVTVGTSRQRGYDAVNALDDCWDRERESDLDGQFFEYEGYVFDVHSVGY